MSSPVGSNNQSERRCGNEKGSAQEVDGSMDGWIDGWIDGWMDG